MTTGEKIKQLRKQLGMTQEDLGNKIGVQKAAINKYETGIVDDLKQSTISSLARALGVSPVVLLSPDEHTPFNLQLFSDSDPDEKRLISAYRGAEPTYQKVALEILENHQKKNRYRYRQDGIAEICRF